MYIFMLVTKTQEILTVALLVFILRKKIFHNLLNVFLEPAIHLQKENMINPLTCLLRDWPSTDSGSQSYDSCMYLQVQH
jgi:hypothetical protein